MRTGDTTFIDSLDGDRERTAPTWKLAKPVSLNVSVVGLSGARGDGVNGVGKSALCARFVHPAHDQFELVRDDHDSVYSACHFRQAILNNDHFLYHGRAERRCNGTLVELHVVEQTEILDAENCHKPFASTAYAPYADRALAKSLSSPGKLMYGTSSGTRGTGSQPVRRQTCFPTPFKVKAYVLVFDPTAEEKRRQHQQFLLASLAMKLKQMKRLDRAVVAVTKCDTIPADQLAQMHKEHQELSRYLQLPVLSVSAWDDVNIDTIVHFLAHRAGRIRGAPPPAPSYSESLAEKQRQVADVMAQWRAVLESTVTSFDTKWAQVQYAQKSESVYKQVLDTCGMDEAKRAFTQRLLEIRVGEARQAVVTQANHVSTAEYDGVVEGQTKTLGRDLAEHGDFVEKER